MGLLDSAKNMFNSAKGTMLDASLNTAVKPFLNRAIAGYGEIHELKIENPKLQFQIEHPVGYSSLMA